MPEEMRLPIEAERTPWVRFAMKGRFTFLVGAAAVLASVACVRLMALAAGAPPPIPALDLASIPLMAVSAGDKPTMALALSVEYPTVGAQYMPEGSSAQNPLYFDASYTADKEYLGYFDADSCYAYVNAPTEVPQPGKVLQDYKRFERTSASIGRKCDDAFSGNFLNWASGSAIDMIRMSLSGGDRFIDTPALTVLQRAVLPDGQQPALPCFFNSSNFPGKRLVRDGGGKDTYFGAVPKSMRKDAANKDIWVGNMLNRIYFGAFSSTPANDCSARTGYTLGSPKVIDPNSNGPGPYTIQPVGTALPEAPAAHPELKQAVCNAGTINCSMPWYPENQMVFEVWYGTPGHWSMALVKHWFNCTAETFGDPGGGSDKKCYLRIPAGGMTAWPPQGGGGLNSDGYFFARVRVCDRAPDGSLQDVRTYGLCQKYPAGNFKPVGAIQKYANDLRLAAFGYVIDQTRPEDDALSSFGGVLRAPMKYVGENTFNDFGAPTGSANTRGEWDLQTGVLHENPEGHSLGVSGVINYLNRFGRTGPSPGRYKANDPVSELHYETLRYLQGRDPSSLATARLKQDPSRADGFPAYTAWTDPYGGARSPTADYSCQKASIVVIGDINTNDPDTDRFALSDGPPNAADAIPDLISYSGWRGVALAFEKNESTMTYIDGAGKSRNVSRLPTTENPANPAPSYSPLIGSAYWARSHDIRPSTWSKSDKRRPGLRVRSFFFDVNEWGESGGTAKKSFRRSKNKFFTAAKYGGYNSEAQGGNSWGNPFRSESGAPDEGVWERPGEPGEPKTYYLAEDARKVLSAFDDIFKDASTAARSIAGAAVSSGELSSAGGLAYQGAFDTESWSGDVVALSLSTTGTSDVAIGNAPQWQAQKRLAAMVDPAKNRRIAIGRAGATSVPVAVSFTWATIDAALKAELARTSPLGSATDGLGQARLNYLRGDRTKEGVELRRRTSILGDIVNSGVTYSGVPSKALAAEDGYMAFYQGAANRAAAVFAGANDGMLHAFDAATGDELFAYIPSWIGPKLAAFTSKDYMKQAYVDATPAVGEAKLSSGWKTVLVGGSGGGGKGVYALDVTSPSNFASSNVLWEFTSKDDADMGYVLSKPSIVKMRVSAPGTPPEYKWFAIVAGGVNNYIPDPVSGAFSSTGQAHLFVLSLDKKPGESWCWAKGAASCGSGSYFKIAFPIGDSTIPSGLISFRVTYGGQREVSSVYAGDLQGNVWKLAFGEHDASEWSLDKLSPFKNGAQPAPLYVAKSSFGVRQPISMAPSLISGPLVQGQPSTLVAIGTGRFLATTDKASTEQQSFYVLFDSPALAQLPLSGEGAISGRGRLSEGLVTIADGKVTVPPFKWGLPTSDADPAQRAGFFFDFAQSGERQISNAVIKGDLLVFGSLNPTSNGATQACAPGQGGNEYVLNVDTGSGKTRPSTVGLLGEPVVMDLLGATKYTKSNSTGQRTKVATSQVLQQGSKGLGPSGLVETKLLAGRLSWRQIHNYHELKDTP
jgi:type IV pilus assembly protein PilY1